MSRSSSEKLYDATDGECVFAFGKGHERWGGRNVALNESVSVLERSTPARPGGNPQSSGEGHEVCRELFLISIGLVEVTLREDPAEPENSEKTLAAIALFTALRNQTMWQWSSCGTELHVWLRHKSHSSPTAVYKCGLDRCGESAYFWVCDKTREIMRGSASWWTVKIKPFLKSNHKNVSKQHLKMNS